MSYRGDEWDRFSGVVQNHIEDYTIPQYGDGPNDFVETMSDGDVELQITKYVKRFGNNARGQEEAQRDLVKIAHYCAILYSKRICQNTVKEGV